MKNKVAIVTGGTRGIGKAVSIELAQEGIQVIAVYARDHGHAIELEKYAKENNLNIRVMRCDLGNPEKREIFIQEIRKCFSEINILVHCAASGVHRVATELSIKHMHWTFEINFFSFHHLITALHDLMPDQSRIIGLTSSGGTRVIPYYAAVGSSKGALESLIRHFALELAPKGITVNAVCPGLVLTDATEAFPERESRIEKTIANTPTGKLTTPNDVARFIRFLCEPSTSQIVGQTFVIDGGKTLMS